MALNAPWVADLVRDSKLREGEPRTTYVLLGTDTFTDRHLIADQERITLREAEVDEQSRQSRSLVLQLVAEPYASDIFFDLGGVAPLSPCPSTQARSAGHVTAAMSAVRVVVQNLQKKPGLASSVINAEHPDVFLIQEIDFLSEGEEGPQKFPARYVSKRGYGTAIFSPNTLENIRVVRSPHTEAIATIFKKTTIAEVGGVQYVSMHGYNGWPLKRVERLVDHVEAVLEVITPDTPALFAGDFNTWTQEHLDAVTASMAKAGFSLVYSWPYPGRDFPLDHAFARGLKNVVESSHYGNEADHRGAVLVLEF